MIPGIFANTLPERRSELVQSIIAPLQAASDAFKAGKIGERELIAVSIAVADALQSLPDPVWQRFGAVVFKHAREGLMERVAELDAEAS